MPYYEVCIYSDPHMGWGYAGTYCFYKAKSEEAVRKHLNKPHDPFWIDHYIRKTTKEEVMRAIRAKPPPLYTLR